MYVSETPERRLTPATVRMWLGRMTVVRLPHITSVFLLELMSLTELQVFGGVWLPSSTVYAVVGLVGLESYGLSTS